MNSDNGHIDRHLADEARVDHAIDAVAREMTEGEPSGALRARVLERIERERRRPAIAVPRWAWAGAAAAVVLAVAAAVWLTSQAPVSKAPPLAVAGSRTGEPSTAARGTGQAAVQSAVVPAAASSQAGVGTAATAAGRARSGRRYRPAVEYVREDMHPVPALAEIEPLRFSSVAPDPLQIAAVEVAPLKAMPAIDIPSLGPDPNDSQSDDAKKEK